MEVNVKVISKSGIRTIVCRENESLLEGLKEGNIYVPAYCGGWGTCKKCRIRVVEGQLKVTKADQEAFSEKELKAGMRLSCFARPDQDCTIQLCTEDENDFEILTRGSEGKAEPDDGRNEKALSLSEDERVGIAVDIGTTTIAMELVSLDQGKVLCHDSRINHQRAYGADVISRIQASVDGAKDALKRSIGNDLLDGMDALLKQADIPGERVEKIVVAANTTMCHLLMGYSCDTLGTAPFTPVNIGIIRTNLKKVLEPVLAERNISPETELIILPGISAFVGADIVAGLLASDFDREEGPSMLIDLGTNGEMVIGGKSGRIATSTAAGPAFEGGNISWGTGSVSGAICAVSYDGTSMAWETIGGQPPVGICGTGVLDITAELVAHEIVDETGLLDEEYFDTGVEIAKREDGVPIVFTQKDVREIQLAKAAVRAGIQVLLKRYGVRCEDLQTVYLAGGFGFRLDVEKAISIGLLPEGFRGKIRIAGNSSLEGARLCLLDEANLQRAKHLALETEEISLGNDPDFNEYYMDAMYFSF